MIDKLLYDQANKARKKDLHVLETHRYGENRLTNQEANGLPWEEFIRRMQPLAVIPSDYSETKYLLTAKNVTWGPRDVNIFAGNPDHPIETLTDLTDNEGIEYLRLNLAIAEAVSQIQGAETHVSHGFNPEDLNSPGNHSIAKLHTHIYVAEGPEIKGRIQKKDWHELDWFRRMSFIEPFAPVFHDFITAWLKKPEHRIDSVLLGKPTKELGYTSFRFPTQVGLEEIFPTLKALLQDMGAEYKTIQSIFSDGRIDSATGRLQPRPPRDREALLGEYLKDGAHYLTPKSKTLLEYLARHLKQATTGKQQRQFNQASDIWITRGLAGALTFSLECGQSATLDFLPRVITTSGVAKTIFGSDVPAHIEKTPQSADEYDISELSEYYRQVINIASHAFPCSVTRARP